MSPELPFMKVYVGEVWKKSGLRISDNACWGVWFKCRLLMHEREERGVLATAGTAWANDEIARACGGDFEQTLACIELLLQRSVFLRTKSGAIYCPDVVAEVVKSKKCSKAGKHGGNPNIVKSSTLKGDPKPRVKREVKPRVQNSDTSTSKEVDTSATAADSDSDFSLSAEPPEKKTNVWAEWVNVRRDLKLTDPSQMPPDLNAGKSLKNFSADELRELMKLYLADTDKWLVECGHALRHLPGKINKYIEMRAGIRRPTGGTNANTFQPHRTEETRSTQARARQSAITPEQFEAKRRADAAQAENCDERGIPS